MIKGTYIYYEDGKEVYRSSNVITQFGKRFITNFIAGNIANAGKDIAVGIDSTAATNLDTRLGFEFYRVPVLLSSTDIQTVDGTTTYSVVYKTTLPQDVSGIISEVGIYPSTRISLNNYDSKFITDFDNILDWVSYSGFNPTSSTAGESKIGDNVLVMDSNGTSLEEYNSYITLDLSGYSLNDSIRVAYYKYDDNLDTLGLEFYHTAVDYYSVDFTPPAGTGYFISDPITLGTLFASSTNQADASQISKLGVVVTPKAGLETSIGLDAIRINDEDTFDPIFGLISRSILSTPLNKKAGRQVDIEYKLDLSF